MWKRDEIFSYESFFQQPWYLSQYCIWVRVSFMAEEETSPLIPYPACLKQYEYYLSWNQINVNHTQLKATQVCCCVLSDSKRGFCAPEIWSTKWETIKTQQKKFQTLNLYLNFTLYWNPNKCKHDQIRTAEMGCNSFCTQVPDYTCECINYNLQNKGQNIIAACNYNRSLEMILTWPNHDL